MNEEQAKEIKNNKLFEIGGHTAHHIALAKFDVAQQQHEIEENKKFLEKLFDQSIKGFAYPHGSYNEISINILKQNEFKYACTTEEKIVTKTSNLYGLPRMQVKNWNGKEFKKQMDAWF